MKRDATQTIWRTVVFAGAMLGTPACTKKQQPQTTPSNAATQPATTEPAPVTDNATPAPNAPAPAEDPADPCAGSRPGALDDDGGGGMGRGFVLS